MDACPTLSELEKRLLWTLHRWQFQAAETLTAIPWFCLEAEHWGEKGLGVRRALNKLCSLRLVTRIEAYPPDGVYSTPNGKRVEVTRDICTAAEVEQSGDGFSIRLPAKDKAVESYELTPAGIEAAQTAIKAGEAFRAAMESDPEAKAAWERTRAKLQAFGEAMRRIMDSPEYRAAKEAERRQWQELADAIRANVQWAGDELEARYFQPSQSIEDWEHLARIVEMPDATIKSGNYTAREVFACALAWADRQKIKAKLSADSNAPTPTKDMGATAEAQDAGDVGGPTEDPHDNRVVRWAGKRIYLGNDTQVSRLFWLLAKPVGRAAKLYEVQRAIDGMETTRDMRPDEVRKTAQRLRKVISKLRAALREAGLDDHVLIVKDGPQAEPQYSMVPRFGK